MVIALSAVLVALVASWIRSRSFLDTLIHNGGTLRAPGEDPDELAMWSFTSHTLQLNHWRGRIGVFSERYKSVGSTEADMAGWRSRNTWDVATYPAGVIVAPARPWASIRSLTEWNLLGLSLTKGSRQGTDSVGLTVPHWMACIPISLALGLVIRGSPAARRERQGRCPKCGYDLKGNLTAGCPECGWNRAKPEANP